MSNPTQQQEFMFIGSHQLEDIPEYEYPFDNTADLLSQPTFEIPSSPIVTENN